MSLDAVIGTRFKAGITGLELSTYQVIKVLETDKESGMVYSVPELLILLVDPITDRPTFKRMFTLREEEYRHVLTHPDSLYLDHKTIKPSNICTFSSQVRTPKSAGSPRPTLRKDR